VGDGSVVRENFYFGVYGLRQWHCLRWWLGGATITQGGDGCYVL